MIKAGLILLRHEQHLVFLCPEPLGQLLFLDVLALGVHVHSGFRVFYARSVRVDHGPGKGHQRFNAGVAFVFNVIVKGLFVPDSVKAAGGHHHGLGLSADLVHGEVPEMLDHDLGLLRDIVRVQAHESRQRPRGLALVHLGIVLDGLDQPVIRLVGRVILKHVEDETLVDGLTHAVEMKGLRLAILAGSAEDLQGFVFGRCREGKEADVGLMPAPGHGLEDFLLIIGQPFRLGFCPGLFLDGCAGEHALELGRRLAALGAVGFVNNHRITAHGQFAHFLGDERELLERGDHNRHTRPEGLGQLGRVDVDLLDHALLVFELVNGVLKLLVEDNPVGDHDDRVENLLVIFGVKAGEPMGQPGNGVGLAAAGGVLNQVVGSGAALAGVGHEFPHAIKLVIAREYHGFFLDSLPTEFLFLDLQVNEPCQNIQEAVTLQHRFPQIRGLAAAGVFRIACPATAAPVEGQKARAFTRKARGHVDLVGVHREMDKGALLELENQV